MFNFAITRKPCTNYSLGITTANLGKPDVTLAVEQYHQYVQVLRTCLHEVRELEPDELFPDSCFVEDTAVIINEAAIITNPGAAERRGEIESMKTVLKEYRNLEFITSPGTLQGGDVMQVDQHFYIGITDRTNKAGAMQLGAILQKFGYSFSVIPMTSALHLKTAVNYIGNNNLLASRELSLHPAFSNFSVIEVADEDLYAANCLFINGSLIMPKRFNRVKSALLKLNYDIIEIEMSEFEKMDGGLTCLSSRFQ